MNTINIFKNIDIYDITILALVLFIFVFLLIVTFSLLRKNKVLKKEIKSLKSDKEINLKNKEEKNISFEEEIPLNKDVILYSKKEEIKEVKESTKEEEIDEILEALPEIKETGPYKKNILRELSARGQTSPVNIGKSTCTQSKSNKLCKTRSS